jgi:hypothetical protein
MPLSQINSASIENASVAPVDLTTGSPSWDSSGNLSATGRLTLPGQPMFSAYGTGSQSWSGAANTQVVQLTTQTPLNAHPAVFNTSNYTFTAPVAGVYMFWAKITQSTAVTGPSAGIYVNGSGASNVPELVICYSVAYMSATGFCALPLAANDLVTLRVTNFNNTSVTLDVTRCGLMGYLIG